jgi:hypothetical protein
MYIYVFSVPLYMVYENTDDWLIVSWNMTRHGPIVVIQY